MNINSGKLAWLGGIFFWSIFMGVTAISIGFGALYPPLNYVSKSFVCPNGQLDYVQTVSNPLPGTTYTQAGYFCTDAASGVKTAIAIFPMSLYSGAIYGFLLFLVVCFFWYMNSRWGSIPIIGNVIQNNGGLIVGVVVVGVVLLITVWSLAPVVKDMFTPPSMPGEPSSSQTGSQVSAQAPAESNAMVTPELSFGVQGTGPGLFNDVRGLGVNSSTGAIFAADYEDGRVQAFDPTGKFLTQWLVGTKDKGAIITGMTADSSGNVFIATGGKILRYDATGKLKGTLTAGHGYINHVALAPDGNLVVMADQETLLRMSTSGKVLSTIQKAFTANGGDTELDAYVAEDSAGDIYALGTFNNAIFKFSPQGKFIKRFGAEGDGPGQLRAAECIAIDSQGRVYVGDIAGIQVYDADGNYQSLITIKGAARYIVFDGQDHMYVTTSQNQVLKMSVP